MPKKWKKPAKFAVVEPTWRGVFVTCPRGREIQCGREALDWLEAAAEELWPTDSDQDIADGNQVDDIEADIKREIEGMKSKGRHRLVAHDRLGVDCVVFVQTRAPVDPVKLVLRVCEEAASRSRTAKYMQRLGPVQRFVHCDSELSEVEELKTVIDSLRAEASFAIHPTLRLTPVKRDKVIPAIARLVGPGHRVDLEHFEELVLVEGFKSVLGAAVLDVDASEMQRFCKLNIAQIIANPEGSKDSKSASTSVDKVEKTK